MSSVRIFGILAVLGCSVLACETSTETDPPPVGGQPGTPSNPSDPNNPDPAAPKPTCKAPTAGPTIHEGGDVGAEEVWTADKSPHIVKQNVNVRNGAKLTIEACAEVRIAKGKTINVAFPITPNTGTLVAKGTETQPIKFIGEEGARWASLSIRAPGTADLAYVTFENGGGGDFQDGATIAAYGDAEDGADPILTVDHVTIKGSLGTGAWLSRGATFGAGSRDLTITGSGSDEAPYPLEIEEHAIDALPTGNYTGNKKDEILIDPRGGKTAGAGLLADATLHDRGVPYHVGRSKNHSLIIGGRTDEKLVTLTIEPGVKLRFTEGSALKVQHFTNTKPSTAALRALGTPEKPIVLTSALDAPAPGAWVGVWFGGVPQATNKIDNVRIEYAGGDCGCILNTCSAIVEHEGSVIFTAQPPSAFITNSTFANGAMHGVTEGYDGAFVDFKPTNKFEGIAGCAQTRPREVSTQCPSPKPACD